MLCAWEESAMQIASERESAAMPKNFFSPRDGEVLTGDGSISTQ
jgi:hypothetical protein